jgi:hypothetical protein
LLHPNAGMLEEYQKEHRRKLARTRSIVDWIMGAILFVGGVFFIVYRFIGIRIMDRKPEDIDFLIGGLFILYGIWRMYRGYKKDYFK